jgi:uncharacterized protein (TIGR03032 family)
MTDLVQENSTHVADQPRDNNGSGGTPLGEPAPLGSVFTANFPGTLQQLGGSLGVTTYQAGFVVILRSDESKLNTHFAAYPRPMGMACSARSGRLALGAAREVVEFRNMEALCSKLEPPGKHDACYLPRRSFVTSDIDVHEMAYVGE